MLAMIELRLNINRHISTNYFLVVFIFLFGCRSNVPILIDDGERTASPVASLTSVQADEFISTSTITVKTPSPTFAEESTQPFAPFSTETRTPTLTKISSPTLAPNETQLPISELLETNGGCEFPCWWGITPGETEWSFTQGFLAQFGSYIHVTGNSSSFQYADIYIPLTEAVAPSSNDGIVRIVSKNGIVETIKVSEFKDASVYKIGQIMKDYGEPEEIWMNTQIFLGTEFPFFVVLFYPQHGLIVTYTEFVSKQGSALNVCLDNAGGLLLWYPEESLSFEEAANLFNWNIHEVPYLPISEATDVEIPAFFNNYSGQETGICVETPTGIWPGG